MKTIIPSILDLIGNPNINSNILDAFYDLEPIPDKYQAKANNDLRNQLRQEISYQPFSINSHGAYIMYSEYQSIVSESMECPEKTFELIKEKYAIGFRDGYFNFEKEILTPKAEIFSTDENKSQIIFDHISRGYPKASEGPAFVLDGFDRDEDADPIPSYFSSVYNTGVKRGTFYRAWFIILQNHKNFEGFFVRPNAENKTNVENKTDVEKKPRKRRKTTFNSKLSDKKILTLFDQLKKNKYIHNETSINLFRSVFREVDSESIQHKVDWIGPNNLLAFFIDMLMSYDLISTKSPWATVERCFTNSKFLGSASSTNKKTDAGQPTEGDIIVKILKPLK